MQPDLHPQTGPLPARGQDPSAINGNGERSDEARCTSRTHDRSDEKTEAAPGKATPDHPCPDGTRAPSPDGIGRRACAVVGLGGR